MKHLCPDAAKGGDCASLKVTRLRAISVYMINDTFGFFFSLCTNVTSNSLAHWWIEIETEDPDVWYCAQFRKKDGYYTLMLQKCLSKEKVTQEGQKGGRRFGQSPSMSLECSITPIDDLNIGQIYDFMLDSCDDKYDLIKNNCQHFSKKFMKWAK
ncbi:unnamed protein product [Moneuplotes crassus]|uniref:PPPDE domain-containing protein n=1 Tax=Euplotes crassus TaxID=5936 RepID=A0AAD1Y1U9_EUPCR|nr:unnamed protein product [Moneuplotes crassus]